MRMTGPLVAVVIALCSVLSSSAFARDFYFDDVNGVDSSARDGLSQANAWRTLTKLSSVTLGAGDRILFRAGGTFDTGVIDQYGIQVAANRSGTAVSPIAFTSWGTGARPILTSTLSGPTNHMLLKGNYVVVDNLHFTNAHDSSIIIEGDHNSVKNCEFENLGVGIFISGGQFTLVTRNYFHDLIMIRNTPAPDDDYGANALVISGSDVEVSWNLAERLIAPSIDYGVDGGFAELYINGGINISNIFIHHNIVKDSDGFSETGGSSNSTMTNVVYAYNLSVNNNGGMLTLHNGTASSDVQHVGFLVENNTVVEPGTTPSRIIWMSGNSTPTPAMLNVRNNIFRSNEPTPVYTKGGFAHSHNLYHLATNGSLGTGVTLDSTELQTNAQFLNETNRDFHLALNSPAINTGLALGYVIDLDGNTVPAGGLPEMGAYEYASSPADGGMGPFDAGASVDAGRVDGGTIVDAGRIDSGIPGDAGRTDSGISVDAGRSDSGISADAGRTDSGMADAGSPTSDAGQSVADAGPLADAGIDPGVDAGLVTDAGGLLPDAGAVVPDAGHVSPDSGVDPGTTTGGCGCTTTSGSAFALWAVLAMLWATRRRLR